MMSKKKRQLCCAAFAAAFSFSNCYIHMLEKNGIADSWDALIMLFNMVVVGMLAFWFADKIFLPVLNGAKLVRGGGKFF